MFRKASYISNICIRAARLGPNNTASITFINLQSKHLARSLSNCSTTQTSDTLHFTIKEKRFQESIIVDNSNVVLDDIEIQLANEGFILNLTSLRDFCFCSKCMHPSSRQKLFTIKDFQRHKFQINEIRTSPENNKIFITWIDGHESIYTINLLRKIKEFTEKPSTKWQTRLTYNYPNDDYYKENIDLKQDTWNVERIIEEMAVVDYNSLIGDSSRYDKMSIYNANKAMISPDEQQREALYQLTKSLVSFGLAKIINVPKSEQEILNVARCLAYERPTGYGTIFDVVVEPSEEINLAYSALEFDLHTDLPYRESMPGVQLLHCIENSPDGGDSYFSDGYSAAKKLQLDYPHLFEVLTQFPTTFSVRDPYRDVKFRRQHPIVSLDYQGDIHEIHYSPFHLPPLGPREDVKLFYLALDKFTQYLQSHDQKLITKMDPGDLYIFHNRRVLHGRSSYDPNKSRRFLQGCYMDWDEVEALYEKLRSHKKKKD